MKKILILGGYGNFGRIISDALAKKNIPVAIAGRSHEKSASLAGEIKGKYPAAKVSAAAFDVNANLAGELEKIKPAAVINSCGPFQDADYNVARSCIAAGVHYIDLADGRQFVCGIGALDKIAKANNVMATSGASTVPALSSAVLEEYKNEFSEIDSLIFGIAPGHKSPRGLATTKAVLSYTGRRLKPFAGCNQAYGWQDIYRQQYPEIRKRWMANCDIPDLDLLPTKYNIKSIRFSAGMESSLLHLSIWAASWLVRAGMPLNLPKFAAPLLKISNMFNFLGSEDGGMHMIIKGRDQTGKPYIRKWFIIARDNSGPNIPAAPSIILATKIASGQSPDAGAYPCASVITLDEYMAELKEFNIKIYSSGVLES